MKGKKRMNYSLPYKIGILSTHGTGKSTLAHELYSVFKKKGYKTKVIDEIATDMSEKGYPINQNTNLPAQMSILMEQIKEEHNALLHGYKIVIADRTVFDNLVYLERSCGKNGYILDFILGYSKNFPYNALYKLPLIGNLQKDGIRDPDKVFQADIYRRLKRFLSDQKIRHIELPAPIERGYGTTVPPGSI